MKISVRLRDSHFPFQRSHAAWRVLWSPPPGLIQCHGRARSGAYKYPHQMLHVPVHCSPSDTSTHGLESPASPTPTSGSKHSVRRPGCLGQCFPRQQAQAGQAGIPGCVRDGRAILPNCNTAAGTCFQLRQWRLHLRNDGSQLLSAPGCRRGVARCQVAKARQAR